MKFCILTPTPQREKLGGFLVANFLSYFPKENGLKFVAPRTSENFTTFSTARKEIYHLELALGAPSRSLHCKFKTCDSIYRSSEALWARNPQKVSRRSSRPPGLRPRVSKKCRKKSQRTQQKSQKRCQNQCSGTFSRLF